MHKSAREAGRDPASIGVECIVATNTSADQLKSLQDQGVTDFALVTMNQGLANPQAHIDAIKQARDRLKDLTE